MRLLKDNTNFDFVKSGSRVSVLSAIFILISLISIIFAGFNTGIDFAGGILFEFRCPSSNIVSIRKEIDKVSTNAVIYQTDKGDFVVKASGNTAIDIIKDAVSGQCGKSIEYLRADYVGSQVSSSMLIQGMLAIVAALLGVMAYLCIRFNIFFAISGIVTLLHDVILLLGFYSLTRLEFNLSSVAALLTIIGYSINDSVVIFDSIRENLKNKHNPALKEIINQAVNQTLSRTILTSFTTLLAAIVLVIFSTDVLRPFSWAICFGLVIGTYSSIVISPQCLIWMRRKTLA